MGAVHRLRRRPFWQWPPVCLESPSPHPLPAPCRSNIDFNNDVYEPATNAAKAGLLERWSGGYLNATTLQNESTPYHNAWRMTMVPELLCMPLEEM